MPVLAHTSASKCFAVVFGGCSVLLGIGVAVAAIHFLVTRVVGGEVACLSFLLAW